MKRAQLLMFMAAWPLVGAATVRAQLHSSEPILSGDVLQRAGYSKFWSLDLPNGNVPIVAAHLVDENLYIKTKMGTVFAVHADTGLVRWIVDLDSHLNLDRSPSHVQFPDDNGPAVFVTHTVVHIVDRFNGDVLRKLDLPLPAGSGAATVGRLMYVGGSDGELYALRWAADFEFTAMIAWHAGVNGALRFAPTPAFDRLYFASDGGVIYCLELPGKSLRWAYVTDGEINGDIHVDESGVYAASTDRLLYVLDPDTGERVHGVRLPGILFDGPTVVQRTVYQYSEGDGLFAFDSDTRAQLWKRPEARRFVARSAEDVVLLSDSNELLMGDNRTGAISRIVRLGDGVMVVTNKRDAVLYLVATDGRVLCAKPEGFPYLRRDEVLRARVQLSADRDWGALSRGGSASGAPSTASGAGDGDEDPLKSRIAR